MKFKLRLLSLFLAAALIIGSILPAANAAATDITGRPANVTASVSASTATLNWSAPSGGTAPEGYLIYRDDVQVGDVTTGTSFTETGLASGTAYTYKLQAYSSALTPAAITIPVATGSIEGNHPPVISSVYPPDGDASYAEKATIYFMASTNDSDGTVSTVKYFNNGVSIGQSSDGKGIRSWYSVPKGDYSIAAMAVDNSGNTFTKVFNISVGTGGNILRQLYDDAYVNTWNSGTTSDYTVYGASSAQAADGIYSLKVINKAEKNQVNYRIISTGLTLNIPDKSQVALQFWIYNDTADDNFRQSQYVALVSQNGSEIIECRLPLSDYVTRDDNGKWKQVTIPLSEFDSSGTYYKGTNGTVTGAAIDFNWKNFIGAGIICSTAGLPETSYYIDDLKYITYTRPAPPPEPPAPIPVENLKTYEAEVLPQTYQTVKGWGIFPGSAAQDLDFPHKYAAHTAIFQELGITMFRAELRGTCGDADGNLITGEMDNIVANIRVGINNGINQYTLHIWTPPAGMKNNNSISGKLPDGKSAALLQEKEGTFAQYIVRALDYLQAKGLPVPVALSFQNEPDATTDYQSCPYTAEQYKRVAKLVRSTLDGSGYQDLLMIGPETGSFVNATKYFLGTDFSQLTGDAEYARAIGAFASHAYADRYAPDQDIRDYIGNTARFPEKDKWMTEFCNEKFLSADTEMERTIEAMKVFSADMAWIGNSYWFWWWGFDPRYSFNDVNQNVLLGGNGATSVEKGKTYEALAAIFNNVPVGSRVKRMSSNDPSVVNSAGHRSDMVAFENDGSTIAMLINTSSENKLYNVGGLSGASARVYSMWQGNGHMQQTDAKNIISGTAKGIVIPAGSVNIIVTGVDDMAPPAIRFDKPNSLAFDGEKYISRSGIVTIAGTTDEAAQVRINGQTVPEDTGFGFSYDVELPAAENTILIEAEDVHGNSSTLTLNILYDPDYLAIDLDDDMETQVNSTEYVIRGTVNALSVIRINDAEVPAAGDLTFECPVELSQGHNSFVLSAADEAGNVSGQVTFDIFCDSQGPEVTILNTRNMTGDPEYVLSGISNEPVKSLKINGKSFSINSDLSFREKFVLAEGENVFIIQTEDMLGNTGTAEYRVNFDRSASTPHYTDGVSYTRRVSGNITVDGNIDEESWVMDNKAARLISSKAVSPNNIVNFGTLWDENNLYFAARVYDDTLLFSTSQIYNNDTVELFLNPDNQKAGAYTGKDKQLFIGYTTQTRDSMYVNSGADYQTGWQDFDGGYTVEMAIPWSSLGLTPGEGLEIGFDVANDDQDIAGGRQNIIGWAGNSDNYRNTSLFGTLILAGQGDVTYVDRAAEQSVDTTAPTTTLSVDKTEDNGWYIEDVNITLSATDSMSGVAGTEYRIDESGDWSTYTGPILLDKEGTYTIQYRSTDMIGIVENIRQQTIKIAKLPDTLTLILIKKIEGMNIEQGIKNNLTAELNDVLKLIQKGNKISLVNELNAFINEVNAQKGKKLTNEQAEELIALADKIITAINSDTTL